MEGGEGWRERKNGGMVEMKEGEGWGKDGGEGRMVENGKNGGE